MGLFNKNKKGSRINEIPSLPDLPKLPDFPTLEEKEERIPRLPSFPDNSLGTTFSQNTIKEAVAGEEEEDDGANEFADEDEMQMMQEPLRKSRLEEIGVRSPIKSEIGPIFVRIDKFEDALKIFRETKRKLSEIERLLEETKKLKEKEAGELNRWEAEVRSMKGQIEKADKDIFSKV
ncbi:MAG: hypothetical protein ABIH65_02940 [Nanoarchaeota archaeon]